MKTIVTWIVNFYEALAEARRMQAEHLVNNRYNNYL